MAIGDICSHVIILMIKKVDNESIRPVIKEPYLRMMKSVIKTVAQLKSRMSSCLYDSTKSHKICFMGFFSCTLIILLACGWWSIIQTDRELRLNLLAETQNLADEIKPKQIEMLSGTISDIDSPFYLQLKEQLSAVRSVNPNCRFLYLLGRRQDNTVFIFADSEPVNSQDYSPPGQIYKEATAECANIFAAKTKIVEGPEQDRWGVWVSGLVPIINQKTGKVLAVLGMDIDAQTWKSELIYAGIPYALFALIIILIFLFSLIQKLHRQCQYSESIILVTIGITLTTAIGLLVNTNEQRHNRDAFFLLANSQAMRISGVFHDLEQTELEGLASLFENNNEVTRSKFNKFAEFLSRNPAIQAWEWIPAVTSSERVHFEQEIRRTELPEFMIWQKDDKGNKIPAQNETTYPVLYISPIPGNEQAFGYDLGSEQTRRAALIKAEKMRCILIPHKNVQLSGCDNLKIFGQQRPQCHSMIFDVGKEIQTCLLELGKRFIIAVV